MNIISTNAILAAMGEGSLSGTRSVGKKQQNSIVDQIPTRTKIILTAEKMFGARSIEAVSLREISAAAGQKNIGAVQYHFKSKAGLAEEIRNYRMPQLEKAREKLFLEAKRRELLSDARTLLEMLLLPHLDIKDDEGKHSYSAFFTHYRYFMAPEQEDFMNNWPVLSKIHALILSRISYVPEYLARIRIWSCNTMFQELLARMDMGPPFPKSKFPAVVDDRFEIMTAALCAPFRPDQAGPGYLSSGYLRGGRNIK